VELQAPSHWQTVDVISDIHLHPSEPLTHAAWEHYLQHCRADALFILGDLFEVWVGDDVLDTVDGFEHQCANSLRVLSQRTAVYLMHGNRDFLMGPRLAHAYGATLIEDPCILQLGTQRLVLSHGDALCLDDTDYQQFRATVRTDTWQHAFLARPLPERQAIAREIRLRSEAAKSIQREYADADTAETLRWLHNAQAQTLIHGHTHRPATHALPGRLERWVLSDWHLDGAAPRAEVLRLQCTPGTGAVAIRRLAPDASEITCC